MSLELEIGQYTSFDFIEEKYRDVVNLINTNYSVEANNSFKIKTYCPPNFILSLIYTILPVENNEEVIKDIFETCKAFPGLFKCSYDEFITHPQIVMLLENKFFINIEELYYFSENQLKILYNYFYEALNEISFLGH